MRLTVFKLLLILLGGSAAHLGAQSVTQLRDTGPRANRINIALLGDGYTAAEAAKFNTDAGTLLAGMLNDESWNRFSTSINAFAIFAPSAESGTDDPVNNITRDTYFSTTFNVSGIDRLLAFGTNAGRNRALTLLSQFVPDYDLAIMLVNSTKYGGAGGSIAVVSNHPSALAIMLHELGHTFALLGDEYVDAQAVPIYPPREYPNSTQQSTRETSPWKHFIFPATPVPSERPANPATVGMYEGSQFRATGFYRPTFESRMRVLDGPFGAVNLQAFAAAVHRLNLNLSTAVPVITQQPANTTIGFGQSTTLRVTATGTGPMTYLWTRNGTYLPDAIGSELTLTSFSSADTGSYTAEVRNASGPVTSNAFVLSAPGAGLPAIAAQPATQNAAPGGGVSLSVGASGATPLRYQWYRNGTAIVGATQSTLTFSSVTANDVGAYSVQASNDLGVASSNLAFVSLGSGRLRALSVRSVTGAGDQTLIAGLVVSGNNTKSLVLRGIGPGLTLLGVGNALDDPVLRIFNGSGQLIDSNDNWDGAPATLSAFSAVGLGPLVIGSRDAALLSRFNSGIYTAQVTTLGSSGIALMEAYDSDPPGGSGRLNALSVRSAITPGSGVLIVGLVVAGESPKTLIIRGIGPALLQAGVSTAIADPVLEIYNSSSQRILTNDNWGGSQLLSSAFAAVGLAALPTDSKDAAMLVTLQPGVYTAQLSGLNGTSGIGLVEVYDTP